MRLRLIQPMRGIVLLAVALVWPVLGPGPLAAVPKPGKAAAVVDEFFASTNIPSLQIEIAAKDLAKLRGRGGGWGWMGTDRDRPEVQVTVREGAMIYTNVALHLKGAAGSFQPLESKPALTLNFDKHVKDQHFHGLTKLSLNNSVQDPSYLSEKISRELFAAAGIPVPRASFATVALNGRKLGLYVLLEGYNRQFLKRHFKNSKGNLYDGGFLKDVDSKLALNAGENPNDQAPLKALVAASTGRPTNRFARLEKVVDMDRFVTFVATEVLLCHWDGYSMNKNNYRVYHDPDSDRLIFCPHGMDQMFGVMMTDASMSVRPLMQGMAAKALMDTPEGRRRFFTRLGELNRTIFNLEAITNRIQLLAERLRPVLEQVSSSALSHHETAVASLQDRIVQRKQSLDDQLTGVPGTILAFDENGTAALSGWNTLTNFGNPLFKQETDSNGRSVLHITAQGNSIGSWRSKAQLEDGHYTFEGRMRTQDVAADARDARAGAGLRIQGKSARQKTLGSSEWAEVIFEFDVPDGIHDVEFVCEMRAAQGEVWFDQASLRLIRR